MIKLDERTEELARQLAIEAGKTPADMIRELLEDRARTAGLVVSTPRKRPSYERMMEISERCSKRPVLDERSSDEIIGYDEFGVPS